MSDTLKRDSRDDAPVSTAKDKDAVAVAVWGCGPVRLFAVQSAFLMGASA